MIKMMFKYELKKIFSKRINQVLLAAVLVVTIIYSGMAIGSMRYVDEEGQDHTGIEAGRLLAENINQWKGKLTAEKISEVIDDYKTISAKYPDEIPNTEYGKTVQSYYDIYSFVIGIMTPDSEWNESVVDQLSDEQLQNIYTIYQDNMKIEGNKKQDFCGNTCVNGYLLDRSGYIVSYLICSNGNKWIFHTVSD